LSDAFDLQNGLKQGDAFSSKLFKFSLEYAFRKVREELEKLKLFGTFQLLVYENDLNLLGRDMP
jgi:hypothetical protein